MHNMQELFCCLQLNVCHFFITGWAVAVTCYINHSAKYSELLILTLHGAKTLE